MTIETEARHQSPSEPARLRKENDALRRQVAELEATLVKQTDSHLASNHAKDALITRLQFELTDVERGLNDAEVKIAQLLDENQRLRDAIVAAASQ